MSSQDHWETWDADVAYVHGVHDLAVGELNGERVQRWTDVRHGCPCHHIDGCGFCVGNGMCVSKWEHFRHALSEG